MGVVFNEAVDEAEADEVYEVVEAGVDISIGEVLAAVEPGGDVGVAGERRGIRAVGGEGVGGAVASGFNRHSAVPPRCWT